jgi:hypothetical protein
MTKKAVSIVDKTAVVNLNSPKALADFSKELKKFIVENELYTNIAGKNYVHVEGWQFAGASMGIFPIVERVDDISQEGYVKYRAEVKLVRISSGDTVGYGIAICSNKEDKKKSFDEYAVASMAQTRAVGKAFRLSIGWIMKLAGYEATTAEEADSIKDESDTTKSDMPIDDVKMLVGLKLTAMAAADKVKFLKDNVNTVTDKNLTDEQYRFLYDCLSSRSII